MINTLSAHEVAQLALGDKCTPFSFKIIQAKARAGELKGRKVGKVWRFLEDEVREWLSYRNGR